MKNGNSNVAMKNGKRKPLTDAREQKLEKIDGEHLAEGEKKRPEERGRNQKVADALVLQGGGALGAYELGVVKRLYEKQDDEPEFNPVVISGVSIGAVNATIVAGTPKGKQADALDKLWRRITVPRPPLPPGPAETIIERMLPVFGLKDFFRPRMDYYNVMGWTSTYDVEPQRKLLKELVNFDYLNNDARAPLLILTATNVSTGNIVVFSNKKYNPKEGKYQPAGNSGITAEHVLASGAIPPGFSSVEIQGQHYWDGGLFNNTPLSPVIESLDRVASANRRRIFLVNLYPNVGKVPSNMVEVFNRKQELHYSNKMIFDVNMMNRVNTYVHMMTIFDKVLSLMADSELADQIRDLDGFKLLMSYNDIKDIVLIQNNEPEPTLPETDFSKATIERRISAGYRDTDETLKTLNAKQIGATQHLEMERILTLLKDIDLSEKSKALRLRTYIPPSVDHENE